MVIFSFTVLSSVSCSSVDTKKVDETHYNLVAYYNDVPRSLTSMALTSKAEDVCPDGYDVLSKSAAKSGTFGNSQEQCAGYKNCDYTLQWRIVCVDKPKLPFSIFGSK